MKLVALSVITAFSFAACVNHSGENQFDTNAAEANALPGDKARGTGGDTNLSAAQRAGEKGIGEPAKFKQIKGDDSFAAAAAEAGLAEVSLGKLAASKTKNEKLIEFAKMMVTDHSAANEQLKSIAEKKGMMLPTECTNCGVSQRELVGLGENEFMNRYSAMMVSDHEKAVALFEKESEHGTDPELKAFAKEKLPALRHHLAMARELQSSVGPTASNKDKEGLNKDESKQADPKTKKETRKEKKEARKAKRNS